MTESSNRAARPVKEGDVLVSPARVFLLFFVEGSDVEADWFGVGALFASVRRTCGEFSGESEGKEVKDLSSSAGVVMEIGFDEPEPLFLGLARTVRSFPLVVEVVEVWDRDRCRKSG